MGGEIKGWNFSRYYSADGSEEKSTQNSITEQKKQLEARLLQIPSLISANEQAIARMQSDYDWLSSLDKRRQREYEKKNSVHPHEAAASVKNKINQTKAIVASLKVEQGRIPTQLEVLTKQMETLIKGESEGLAKGLDKESAQALGEIELEKEKAQLEHQAKLAEIEEKNAEQIALEEAQKRAAGTDTGSNTKLIIGISITVVLIIIGIMLYRKQMAKGIVQPLKA